MFKHKSIFVKLLVFFNLFVLAAILAFGYLSYTKSSSLLIDEVVSANNKYIEQARNNIDKALMSWDVLSYQISLQSDVRRSMYLTEQTWNQDQLLFYDIIQFLRSVKHSNRLISDIWLQPYRYPAVLNFESKYDRDYYYTGIYTTKPELPWKETVGSHFGMKSMGHFDVVSYDKPMSVVTFARMLPPDEMVPSGVLYFSVNAEDLSGMLHSGSESYPAFLYVVDASGRDMINSPIRSELDVTINSVKNIITDKVRSSGTGEGYLQDKISGKSYEIVFTTSQFNDWTYISVVPTAFITEKANKFRQFTLVAAILCLSVGLVISYFLSERIYRPINHMVGCLQLFERKSALGDDTPKREDEIGFIDRIINYVYYENHHLKEEFQKNLPALQQKFLYDMLEGRTTSERLAEASEKLQLPFSFGAFQILVFEPVDFTLDDRISPYDIDIISEIDGFAAAISRSRFSVKSIAKRNSKIVSVVNLDYHKLSPEVIDEFIRKVTDHFQREYGRSFTVGVGNATQQVEDISYSYVDALSALQYKLVKGQGSIIYVDEVRKLPERSFIYSFDMEKRIINAVKICNTSALSEYLHSIWSDNLESGHSTPSTVMHLFHSLAGTVLRTMYEVGSTPEEVFGPSFDLHRELESREGIEEKKDCIEQAFQALVRWLQEKKEGQYAQLLRQIESFTAEHYRRDISLTMLSEAIGLSPSYVSSIFKDVTGMHYVDYINAKRIEQSKLLMRNTKESIAAISESVGFSSANTFIRVFKRHEGITPGQYRQVNG
ncbi:helix-turn-helix domain-containing protein [Paenibacillus alkalitolerans]|uniref:helix-turn-helix domain-containing protein n=1 Tax=Paenibacillus alkalitolerans TaxID=2799335 RepID=UPI0018F436A3|nr:helix-turn-helix domain-containing protein [Paenibacillus alkalitolerans]